MKPIDPSGKVFAHLDRVVAWRQGYMPAPVTVEFDLSNRCTLGCSACHFSHTHTRGPWASNHGRVLPMAFDPCGDLADPQLVKRVLREMVQFGVRGVIWSGGGEPTTHPHWLEIARYAHQLGLEQGMYTLGGLLTEESAAELRSLATWVVVSLDCATGEDYAAAKGVPAARFDAACNGLRWLSGGKATVGASFLLHAGNWRKASDMLALARSLGASYTTFRPVIDTSPAKPGEPIGNRAWITDARLKLAILSKTSDVVLDVDRFLQYRDWQGHGYDACQGIQLSTTITPDGRMWVCPQRRGMAGSCIGDLNRESFQEVWRHHPRQWTEFQNCRVMCRLHATNQVMSELSKPRMHEAFV